MGEFQPKEMTPDLRTQLESLLDAVWRNERDQAQFDRWDRQAELEERRGDKSKKETDA
jgi:hypothetical protein